MHCDLHIVCRVYRIGGMTEDAPKDKKSAQVKLFSQKKTKKNTNKSDTRKLIQKCENNTNQKG